jgi:hypothetical protein
MSRNTLSSIQIPMSTLSKHYPRMLLCVLARKDKAIQAVVVITMIGAIQMVTSVAISEGVHLAIMLVEV